jgi:ComF family protein
MKKPRFEGLRRACGEMMGEQLVAQLSLLNGGRENRSCLLVPVPNHWSHGITKAANTAESLAWSVSSQTGIAVLIGAVKRIRKTAKQGMLTWAERRHNVRGAFALRSTTQLIGRHIVLVDDVLTSGATAAEISRLLIQAGAAQVTVLVVARGIGTREIEAPGTDGGRAEQPTLSGTE